MTALYQWTLHGTRPHCAKCQSLAGKILPLGAWSLRPGFHPHCDCTLDLVGDYELIKDEPTIFISILAFPIAQYWDDFNPIKSTDPIAFPLCPFISNAGQAANSPYTIVPMPGAFPSDFVVPVPVDPPEPGAAHGSAGASISDDYVDPRTQAGHPGRRDPAIAI